MSLAMTKEQRQAYLADTHVAIISIPEAGRGPLTVPIWYTYTPGGDVCLAMAGNSKKAKLIGEHGRFTLCVQTEAPPYQYVTVEGPATIGGLPDLETFIRPMARRYLGEQMGDLYIEMTAEEREGGVLVTMTPARWLSVDYTKMAEQAGA